MRIYQGNNARTGVITARSLKDKPRILWSFDFGRCLREEWCHPLVWEGNVYFTAYETTYALDAATGRAVWKRDDALANPTIEDGVLYTCGRTAMQALDAATGRVLWRTEADGLFATLMQESNCMIKPSPAVTAERAIFCGPETSLFALDRRDGGVAWRVRAHAESGLGAPVVADGKVFAATLNSPNPACTDEQACIDYCRRHLSVIPRRAWEAVGKRNHAREAMADASLVAFSETTGEALWRLKIADVTAHGRHLRGQFAFAGGTVYAATSPVLEETQPRCEFIAVDAATGRCLWTLPLPLLRSAFGPVSVRGPRAYVTGMGNGLVEVDLEARRARVLFARDGINEICSRTIVEPDGIAYLSTASRPDSDLAGALVAVDLAAGGELWRWSIPGAADMLYPYIVGAPDVFDGKVYLATMTDEDLVTHRGQFYCLGV